MRKTKKYNKTNYIKPFSMGLLLLCSVSLISVGFSSWYNIGSTPVDATVTADVAKSVELNDVFEIQTPQMFSYNKYGIMNGEMFSSDGFIYFPIIINTNASNYKIIKKENNDLNFTLTITNKGTFDIFNDDFLKSTTDIVNPITYGVSNVGFTTSCDVVAEWSKKNQSVSLSVKISGSEGFLDKDKVYINTACHFSFDDFSSVYSVISKNGLSFYVEVGVETI